jgi:serine/threonine protein kinase
MKIELIEYIDNGAFADIWKAKDELEREVAVKIIREASINISDALDHARALARTSHKNVVKVFSIDKVIEPESGQEVDGVIMEFINGSTLESFLEQKTLSGNELRAIGLGIIDGVKHIHDQGLAHGDLHVANVMIQGQVAKIIDILYLDSLAIISTTAKSKRLERDLVSLRLILQQLIHKSELIETVASQFNNELAYDATISRIRDVFYKITENPQNTIDSKTGEELYRLLMEDGFVDSERYAIALNKETENQVIPSILIRMIHELSFDDKHSHYVNLIWQRIDTVNKNGVFQKLNEGLDNELPSGRWTSLIRLIQVLGKEVWDGLSERIKIKTEGVIVKDILAGYTDIFSSNDLRSGDLGTYATILWEFFDDKDMLVNNIISLLRQNWYGQNYIGNFFINILYPLAVSTNRELEIIEALKNAVSNDAKRIKENISLLPEAWVNLLNN